MAEMNEKKEYQNHYCEYMPTDGVAIVYADLYDVGGKKQWWFYVYEEASEKDVEEFEAEEVGEILWSNEITILFCPFCGVDLNSIEMTCS
jgi:hypothetical protein